MRVGINGFGRMGRLVLRAAWGWPELEFVHINEIEGGPEVAVRRKATEFDCAPGTKEKGTAASRDSAVPG